MVITKAINDAKEIYQKVILNESYHKDGLFSIIRNSINNSLHFINDHKYYIIATIVVVAICYRYWDQIEMVIRGAKKEGVINKVVESGASEEKVNILTGKMQAMETDLSFIKTSYNNLRTYLDNTVIAPFNTMCRTVELLRKSSRRSE